MTVLDEFYKVGPGPSSSHTIGPMRITYDFYQRCTKLPPDQLAKATGLKVHLFGSLSATGKGHGTEPHLGTGAFGSTNSVLMVAFDSAAPLEALLRGIDEANQETRRPSDRIRLFQMPLERIV